MEYFKIIKATHKGFQFMVKVYTYTEDRRKSFLTNSAYFKDEDGVRDFILSRSIN